MKLFQLQVGPKAFVCVRARSLKAAKEIAYAKHVQRNAPVMGYEIVDQDEA
jgi:hypothetical protein